MLRRTIDGTTLTDEEARCASARSQKDYVQARIDGAIRFSFDGREFKNRYTCADGTECRQFEVTATGARCALCPDVRSWSLETDFLGLLGNLKNHCGQGRGNQRQKGQLHRERLASAAAAPPVATADEAGIVLGVSRAQARRLATAAAAGCLIIREVVAPPRPPPSANELKLREELARLKQENERRKAPRRSGRARPPDATVETKSDDDGANDELRPRKWNKAVGGGDWRAGLLWGADVRRSARGRERKGRGQKRPGRWEQSSENDSAARGPRRLWSPRCRSRRERAHASRRRRRSCLRLRW